MKLLKSDFRTFTTVIALGVLGMGFAPVASAISTYDATAAFTLTLTDVTDANGGQVTSGWDVTAFGDGAIFFNDSGAASATGSISVIDPAVSLSILDSITQSSTSSGSASFGFASTDALTDLLISVENFSGQSLTFNFDFAAMTDAMTYAIAPDEASATATVDMLDDLGAVDIIAIAEAMNGDPSTGTGDVIGSFFFELADGGFNDISGFVDSFGSAEAVPVPAAVWLFGSGLLGLVGIARRKQTA